LTAKLPAGFAPAAAASASTIATAPIPHLSSGRSPASRRASPAVYRAMRAGAMLSPRRRRRVALAFAGRPAILVLAAGDADAIRRPPVPRPKKGQQMSDRHPGRKVPVILDTDIGIDVDDTWALALLLKSPELELKLLTTCTGDTRYRARLAARMLQVAGRSDVPVGIGIPLDGQRRPQEAWAAGFHLGRYAGTVHEDGVGAMVETIMSSPQPVTLIAIGPTPNVAAALARQPQIARRCRYVGMQGNLRPGDKGGDKVVAEYNVVKYPHSCQAVFAAPWEMTITPLDTCGRVRLHGGKFAAVRDSGDPLARAVIENYRLWTDEPRRETESSILFDTVAVYLAFAEDLLVMEDLPVRVTDEGFTVIEQGARRIRCATDWKDLPAFEDLLVRRLTT